MENTLEHGPFILGLDLGAESVGWAMLGCQNGGPSAILRAGVHCFDAGVEGDVASGRDESRAKARRDARQPRRQHWRRAWRRQKLLRILQRHELMPPGPTDTPQAIHDLISSLDAELRKQHCLDQNRITAHLLPYLLRAKALDQRVEPYELGRAIYHLAQRRGFLSNRKALKKDEDEGVLKGSIIELEARIKVSGARTLGEYLSRLDPETERLRRRWTSRQMYLDEFDAIWSTQNQHHGVLTQALKERIHEAIFYQRPMKSQRHLIGECELMPGRKRAPLALRIAQRFRLLQKVNDLLIFLPDGSQRSLTEEERQKVVQALDTQGDLTFTALKGKKLLGLPKASTFNLEEGGEKRIPGNRTDAALREVLGERWDSLKNQQRDQVVEDLLSFEESEPLIRRAMKVWGLDREKALQLSEVRLEQDYAQHCRSALALLVEQMADRTQYATARKRAFPETMAPREPVDLLPPVLKAVPALRNPAVCRALTELRKVVNAIIRRHGKPDMIRIELARDLKRPRKQRQELSKRNRQNEARREDAKKRILAEMGIPQPSGQDIEKVLLAEECDWTCPYTGRRFGMRELLGKNPQYDIEHILPMSKSLDNTFLNKTLCYHEENRHRKRNHTPVDAYGADPGRWNEIIERVKRFKGDAAREKLRRFAATEIPEEFTQRQLQDTRYTSRLAGEYLGSLYGGRSDASGRLRIQVSAGGVTAHLRREWMMNSILGEDGEKTRSDHRHHAVDAIAIALAGPATVKLLADAAGNALQAGRRLFAPVAYPWDGFLDQAREAIDRIKVSHRTTRRLSGAFHAETFYSKPIPGKQDEIRHVRKELHKLSRSEISGDQIVDPIIRRIVQTRYEELGKGDPAKVFADPAKHPRLVCRDGRHLPIHKVRLKARVKPWPIGTSEGRRFVTNTGGSNHHMVIVAVLDHGDGRETKWKDRPVSRFEVNNRRRLGQPVVQPDCGPNECFKFSLAADEYVIMQDDAGQDQLYRVSKISQGDIEFRLHCDARPIDQIAKAKARTRAGAEKLRRRNARKVQVTHLGEVIPAND